MIQAEDLIIFGDHIIKSPARSCVQSSQRLARWPHEVEERPFGNRLLPEHEQQCRWHARILNFLVDASLVGCNKPFFFSSLNACFYAKSILYPLCLSHSLTQAISLLDRRVVPPLRHLPSHDLSLCHQSLPNPIRHRCDRAATSFRLD